MPQVHSHETRALKRRFLSEGLRIQLWFVPRRDFQQQQHPRYRQRGAQQEEPQIVTTHGKWAVVVLSVDDYS